MRRSPRRAKRLSSVEVIALESTFARCVEQCHLKRHCFVLRERLFDGHLHAEGRVGIDIRQNEQVDRPDETIAVKRVNRQS